MTVTFQKNTIYGFPPIPLRSHRHTNMAMALRPRQPYSIAVPSTRGWLHPLVPEEREVWRRRWSLPLRVRKGRFSKASLIVMKFSKENFLKKPFKP